MTIVPISKLTVQTLRSGTEGFIPEMARQINEQIDQIVGIVQWVNCDGCIRFKGCQP
jgi:hypothetical protein